MSDVPPHRRNVNTVFQSYALFPFLDVFGNVAFGLRNRGVSKADLRRRVNESLDLVRMSAFANRRPGQLSGGQNRVPGMVERVVFLGAATQVLLRLAPGVPLQALPQNDGQRPDLVQGTPVQVFLPPEAPAGAPRASRSSRLPRPVHDHEGLVSSCDTFSS